ncbi:glycosyl hydrolase [Bacteroidota bacterium]
MRIRVVSIPVRDQEKALKFYTRFKLNSLIILVVTGSFFLTQCNTNTETFSKSELEKGFVNPSTENRPLALWPWLNGFVDTTKLVYELEQMKSKGMRGALIWDVGALSDPDKMIPAGPPMLSDQSLEYFSIALNTANKLDLDIGWFASSSWNAGGPWVEEANAAMELISSSQVVEGPSNQIIKIKKPKSNVAEVFRYSLMSSLAIPYSEVREIDDVKNQTILLDEFTSENKYIEWEVPQGKWEIISFFMSNSGQKLECPSPNSNGLIIDHLSRIATQNYFDSVLTRLAPINTPENHLKFLMLDSYEVRPMTDWSPLFVEEFKSRYAYDPTPFFPLLQAYSSKDTVIDERFRGDYSRLVSDMMIDNHFAQSVTIADKYGFEMVTEAGHGGYPRVDPLKALGNSHIPMGEFWNRQRFWVTKEAASAAHIYGKKLVASESLTGWNHWQHGPSDFKQLIDIAFCEGLNQVVFHTFAHNPEIAGKPGFVYHAGEHINVNTSWWDMARPFMDYIGRCSYMLRQGNFVGDACLYYGDQAPNLVPPKRIDPNITPIYNDDQCLHCGKPKPINVGDLPGYDYDYINADIITTTLTAENGKLVLPSGISYHVMLLPDRVDISLEVLRSLEKLVFEGAIVIGRRPERTTSLENYPECDAEVKSIADKLWGRADGEKIFSNKYGKGKVYVGKSVKEVLEEMNVGPDFEVKGMDNREFIIDYIHRQTETEEIYFVSNSSPAEQHVFCTFRVSSNMLPELWDAETGLIQRDVEYSKVSGGISIELIMDPLSSRFVVFRNNSTGINDAGLTYDLQFGFFQKKKAREINESIDITNNWNIEFNTDMGGPKSYQMEKLTSWSDIDNEGIKYYSGSAKYSRNFSVSMETLSKEKEAFVVFENIQEMAHVFVNGNDCGIVWTPPYKVPITPYLKAGTNNITVQVINTWNNRVVGDVSNPNEKAYTNTNAKNKFNKNSPLLKSGLIGNAEIRFNNN